MLEATGDTAAAAAAAAAAGSATTKARAPNAASSSSRCSERHGLVQYTPQAGSKHDRFEDQERGVQREETTSLREFAKLGMGGKGLSVTTSNPFFVGRAEGLKNFVDRNGLQSCWRRLETPQALLVGPLTWLCRVLASRFRHRPSL